MRLDDRPESDQVEDERGGGGIGGRHIAGGGIGVVVIAIIIGLITGHSPLQILQLLTSSSEQPAAGTAPSTAPAPPGSSGTEDAGLKFVRIVLADTEQTWTEIFKEHGRRYELPKLVLFDGGINSGCGMTSSAVRAFLLPGRLQGLPRPLVLSGAFGSLRRSRRFRQGLCDRP